MTQWSNQRLHLSCGSPVSYETVSAGYDCVCPDCDEDLFLVETYVKPLQATEWEWADTIKSIVDNLEENNLTPMEILADEIKKAKKNYEEHWRRQNDILVTLPALMYLKGLEMAQAIMKGDID